jgi:NAD-dependent deacetylase
MQEIQQLQKLIDSAQRIVFFGGAGVSTESGIKDFRSVDGLYHQQYDYPPEIILSHSFFEANPREFYRFYREKMLCPDVQPNGAHRTLARLEASGKLTAVITQNIDGLHQAAGSKEVLELHGSVHRNYCVRCRKEYSLDHILHTQDVPRCTCGGIIRPDVVLYEESLDGFVLSQAIEHLRHADLLIVGGTSLVVYPAAGLLRYYRGRELVLMNRDETPYDGDASLIIRAPIGKTLEQLRV